MATKRSSKTTKKAARDLTLVKASQEETKPAVTKTKPEQIEVTTVTSGSKTPIVVMVPPRDPSEPVFIPSVFVPLTSPAPSPQLQVADEKQQAREIRRQKKLEELAEIKRRREAANQTERSVSSMQVAKIAKPDHRHLPSDLPRLADNQTSSGRIKVPIPENLRYKILYFEKTCHSVIDPIKAELKKRYQEMLAAEIDRTMKTDPKCVKAAMEVEAVVKEVLAAVKAQLPDGYIPEFVATESGVVIAKPFPALKD